jgi:hypothetical protein
MEQQRTPRRPRPRLKVPILGDLGGFGGSSAPSQNGEWGSKLSSRITPLLVLFFAVGMFFYSRNSSFGTSAVSSPSEIQEEAWENFKVVKKFPEGGKRLLIELKGKYNPDTKQYKRLTYDLSKDKNNTWDWITPYDYVTKKEGSFEIKLKSYSGKDTTLVMKFE